MNVLLINPPHEHIIRESLPESVEVEASFFPPLGILYLAANARLVEGVEVAVVDCPAEGMDIKGVCDLIGATQPDVVGISAMTHTWYDALLCAKVAKDLIPGVTVVMGGHHISLYPSETLAYREVDAVIMGEGEIAFHKLVRGLHAGEPIDSIPGIVTRDNLNSPGARIWQHVDDLDSLAFPARDLIRTELYKSPLASRSTITSMGATRGCPGKCSFCSMSGSGTHFRARSAANVLAEMLECIERLGIEEFSFYDDTFTTRHSFVLEFCKTIREAGVNTPWEIRSRVDTMREDMLEALARAGCERIFYGVETGSPKIQKRLCKNLELDKTRQVFDMTRKAGIQTFGYFMIGCPDETRADFDATLDYMVSLPMDYAQVSIFTPYPGTAIYHQALAEGIFPDDYWRDFARNPGVGFHPRLWNQHFSNTELRDMLKEAYRKFYARPAYLIKRLLEVRSLSELYRKGRLGFKLLFNN